MASKEIIIDGVDVRKCVKFRDDVYTDKQINNACSIGLWQRHYSGLEENCKMSCECKNNPNCYFKQCARAKNKIDYMEEDIKIVENARNDLERELKRKEQECNSYKQTLREIQQDLEYATYCESQECGCDDANECLECTKKQILQKISECEANND